MAPTPPDAGARPPYGALALYAVAMAILEAAVVVYLRKLYHAEYFPDLRFPLQPIPRDMALTELGREAATVAMIWAVAHLSGRTGRERFAAFAFVFGVWDIFYYVFLKILIGWPTTLLDRDILFLIPAPWVGPVLAPLIVSVQLVILALLLHPARPCGRDLPACPEDHRRVPTAVGRGVGLLYLLGAALVLWTFLETNVGTADFDRPVNYPQPYRWDVFAAGMACGAAATGLLARKRQGTRRPRPSAKT